MLNNIASFNQALALLGKNTDPTVRTALTFLINIMQQQIKILNATVANGISIDQTGKVELGLATASASGALSAADWTTFNNKCSKEEAIAFAIALGG